MAMGREIAEAISAFTNTYNTFNIAMERTQRRSDQRAKDPLWYARQREADYQKRKKQAVGAAKSAPPGHASTGAISTGLPAPAMTQVMPDPRTAAQAQSWDTVGGTTDLSNTRLLDGGGDFDVGGDIAAGDDVAGYRRGGLVRTFNDGGLNEPTPDELVAAAAAGSSGPGQSAGGSPSPAPPPAAAPPAPAAAPAVRPAAPPVRKALNDQTRTAALNSDDPQDMAETADETKNALLGALHYGAYTFHQMKPDQFTARGAEAHRNGAGAADPKMIAEGFKAIDPDNELSHDQQMLRLRNYVYEFHSMRGDMDKANKAAFEVQQFATGLAQKHAQVALQMLKAGDQSGAANETIAAHNWLGTGVQMQPGPNGTAIIHGADGKPHQIPFGPQQMYNMALGLSNRDQSWNLIAQRVKDARKGPDDEKKAIDKNNAVLLGKIREQRLAKGAAGPKGKAGPKSAAASPGMEQLKALFAPPSREGE